MYDKLQEQKCKIRVRKSRNAKNTNANVQEVLKSGGQKYLRVLYTYSTAQSQNYESILVALTL